VTRLPPSRIALGLRALRTLFGPGDSRGPVTVEVRPGAKRWRVPAVAVDPYRTRARDDEHVVRP
jgi:hypothetical protein